MEIILSEVSRKVSIGGIKFSEKLVQISLTQETDSIASFNGVLRLLANKRFNIPFLCHSSTGHSIKSSFCVSHEDFAAVQGLLTFPSLENLNIVIIRSVGTITLFPHRNSFNLLGQVLKVFAQFKIPVHSLSTSISTIALNTDFELLPLAAEKLQDVFFLPENHAPFRQEFRLTQLQ